MRTHGWAWAAVVLAAGAAARPAESVPPVPPERLQGLVARLGSNLFREREAATRELDDLGPAALDALRQAAQTGDPETRRRATTLIDRISARLDTARILAPTLVELDYKNLPLAEALQDLSRRTGLRIVSPEQARLPNRTVTVATGPVPLWRAVEQFCRKADLHEWDGFTPLPGGVLPEPTPASQQVPVLLPQGQVIFRAARPTRIAPPINLVALLDGPGPALPAHHAGAVRVRCLPPNTPFPAAGPASDDVILPLQVSAEPRLNWQPLDVRVDRAVDDQGQVLKAAAAAAAPTADVETLMILANGAMIAAPTAGRGGPAAVRLKAGPKPAKRLTELAGGVAGQVRVTEPVVTLDAPEKAVGQTARGGRGATLALTDFARLSSGEVKVTAEVQLPADAYAVPPAFNVAAGLPGAPLQVPAGVVVRQAVIGRAGAPGASHAGGTDCQGLALEDAHGRRFTVANGLHELTRANADGTACRITALFAPPAAGAAPAKLVFSAARTAVVEVPFVLKDVPLP
jgi:hypothetical protein